MASTTISTIVAGAEWVWDGASAASKTDGAKFVAKSHKYSARTLSSAEKKPMIGCSRGPCVHLLPLTFVTDLADSLSGISRRPNYLPTRTIILERIERVFYFFVLCC